MSIVKYEKQKTKSNCYKSHCLLGQIKIFVKIRKYLNVSLKIRKFNTIVVESVTNKEVNNS